MKKILLALAFICFASSVVSQKKEVITEEQYDTLLNKFKMGKLRYAEMPHFAKSARQLNDTANANKISVRYINHLFKSGRNQLFAKENLEFIRDFMGNTESNGFKLFMEHRDKINEILGKNAAEYTIRYAISKQFIPEKEEWEKLRPDWDSLEKQMTTEFGPLGQEMVYGKRMIYYSKIQDWENYGKYYQLYFDKALQRPEYIINNVSWTLFLNVRDMKVLEFACDVVMEYAMGEWYQSNVNAWDTYANLLYKTGKTRKAIEWEEKAVKFSKNEKSMVETLEKMKKGEPAY